MKTSDPNIYAAGDVAEYDETIIAMCTVAMEQGRVAGACAVGDDLIYEPTPQPVNFEGLDIEVFSVGDVNPGDIDQCQSIVYDAAPIGQYRRLIFRDEKFIGGILIGDTSKAPYILRSLSEPTELKVMAQKVMG